MSKKNEKLGKAERSNRRAQEAIARPQGAPEKARLVSLITDFGLADLYPGVMKAVILGICPQAEVVDLTHGITPFGVPEAGFVLHQGWRYFPKGSVHVVVVDPGVGTERRGLVVEAFGHQFVGPDNGVFSMLYREAARAAKPGKRGYTVRVIENEKWMFPDRSNTFHGRDVFAPVAAHLAAGKKASAVGSKVEDALRQDWDLPVRTGKRFWNGTVLKVDHFGNLITNLPVNDFPLSADGFELQAGAEIISKICGCYADASPGENFLIAGSAGFWEISRNQGSASKALGLVSGSPLELAILR